MTESTLTIGNGLPVPCLVCGKALDDCGMGDGVNQPHAATAFTSSGHYGSTSFDPFNASCIEINICEACLGRAMKQERVLWRREALALHGAPPWADSCFGWLAEEGPYEIWTDSDGQNEMVKYQVESREHLIELIDAHGFRSYGGVKLNGRHSTNVDDAWPTDATFVDGEL